MPAFVPGKSGNPSGRPKKVLADGKSLNDLAREHTEQAIRTLVKVMQNGESEASRVGAAIAVLDRGWGKPAQSVALTGPGEHGEHVVQIITRRVVDPNA